jgi:alkylation response protein AidB-like acyl-CoA dehydrogenase
MIIAAYDKALLAQGTQTAVWVTATCIRVVDACFAAGGGSALYESSPLQRRMRDLHTAAQHVGVQSRHYANSGEILLDSSAIHSKIAGDPPTGARGEGSVANFANPPE